MLILLLFPWGLRLMGQWEYRKGPAEVAWFNLGPRLGESGSAVIAGHYGWKNNIPAVFDNLHKLRNGDKISVEDEKGVATTFVVCEIQTYSKDIVSPATISNGTLCSIPCEIYFNRLSGSPSTNGTVTISTTNYSKTITISATGVASAD